MKKLLLVFLGVALLAQGLKLWERGDQARSVRRATPAVIHQQHPLHAAPKIMLA